MGGQEGGAGGVWELVFIDLIFSQSHSEQSRRRAALTFLLHFKVTSNFRFDSNQSNGQNTEFCMTGREEGVMNNKTERKNRTSVRERERERESRTAMRRRYLKRRWNRLSFAFHVGCLVIADPVDIV